MDNDSNNLPLTKAAGALLMVPGGVHSYSWDLTQIREKAHKNTLWKWDRWGRIGLFTYGPEGVHPF